MQKYIAIVVAFALVALIYSWTSPSGARAMPQHWEFSQVRLVQLMPDVAAETNNHLRTDAEKQELDSVAEQNKKNQADFDASLAKCGSEGWELVTVTSQPSVRVSG